MYACPCLGSDVQMRVVQVWYMCVSVRTHACTRMHVCIYMCRDALGSVRARRVRMRIHSFSY